MDAHGIEMYRSLSNQGIHTQKNISRASSLVGTTLDSGTLLHKGPQRIRPVLLQKQRLPSVLGVDAIQVGISLRGDDYHLLAQTIQSMQQEVSSILSYEREKHVVAYSLSATMHLVPLVGSLR